MQLTDIEKRIVAAAPKGWLDQPTPPMCTVGECRRVVHSWGTCMCLLVRSLQNERDNANPPKCNE